MSNMQKITQRIRRILIYGITAVVGLAVAVFMGVATLMVLVMAWAAIAFYAFRNKKKMSDVDLNDPARRGYRNTHSGVQNSFDLKLGRKLGEQPGPTVRPELWTRNDGEYNKTTSDEDTLTVSGEVTRE